MDKLAIAGAILGFAAVMGGNVLEGGTLSSLWNAPAAVIVLGGTFGAVLLQTPADCLRHTLAMLPWVVQAPDLNLPGRIKALAEWSRTTRKSGLLGLERILSAEKDAFRAKGVQMVIDGTDPTIIRRVLETELENRLEADLAAAGVFHSMGGYAPTIGIIGAVLGLIQVMSNLADPGELGPGIATAFVATIYGVGFANLLFLPVSDRLTALAVAQSQGRRLFIDGLIAIAEGDHPKAIELRLESYLT